MNNIPLNNLEPRKIVMDAISFFRVSLSELIVLFVPLLLITSAAELYFMNQAGDDKEIPAAWIAGLIFRPFYTAVLILYIQDKSVGNAADYKGLLLKAVAIWLPVFIVSFAVAFVVVLGLYAFIIPGIWIAVRLALSEYFVIVKRYTPLDAIRESYKLSEGRFWQLLSILLIAVVPIMLFGILMNSFVDPETHSAIIVMLSQTLVSFVGLFSIIVLYRVFMLLTENEK